MPALLVGQYKVILLSLFLGAILGLFYELYSFLGGILGFKSIKEEQTKSKIRALLLFFWDFLYFIIITPFCAIFLYGVNFGIVRWYILLCWLIGVVGYKVTLGVLLGRILNPLVYFVRNGVARVISRLKKLFKKVCKKKSDTKKKTNEKIEVFSLGIKNNRA